jgi:hypothetical protein
MDFTNYVFWWFSVLCLFCWLFHKYIWLYSLKQKSQVKNIFLSFKAITKKHFNQNIHTLYSNNDGEYIALANLLTFHDISHLTTPPHTPKQNGFSERRHLLIVKTGLTLLSHASIPLSYWSYAFATAVYLINRMPTKTLNMFSPYKKIFDSPPNYSKLKVFRCLCYSLLRLYTSCCYPIFDSCFDKFSKKFKNSKKHRKSKKYIF